ncbi:MAG: DUF99 family protein [Methanobacteriota archaeon]|nr:MAG: DUF99 family protein [Euryarchaeota archaeon]
MKPHVRVLGVDDSPFSFDDSRSLVVGALVRTPSYLEALMKTEVTVDGTDGTDGLVEMISSSRYREQIKVIMLDGVALAGFNVIDIVAVHESLKLPVLTITRDPPDFEAIRSALRKHFDDWRERFALVKKLPLREMPTSDKPILAAGIGLEWREFQELVKSSTVRGVIPEPIRMAHLVSAAMAKGESRGRS